MMNLYRRFLRLSTVYCQIRSNRLKVICIDSGKVVEDTGDMAIENSTNRVMAVGRINVEKAVNSGICSWQKTFPNPETVFESGDLEEALLKYFVKMAFSSKTILAPNVIFHVPERRKEFKPEEIAAFKRLGERVGARAIFIWSGQELAPQQITDGHFTGGQWLTREPQWAVRQG